MKPFERLQEHWRRYGYDAGGKSFTGPNSPTFAEKGWLLGGEAAVSALEHRYEIALPIDFREHLAAMPVNREGLSDDICVCFWSPDRVESIADGYEQYGKFRWPVDPRSCLMFCDYVISCGVLAIACQPGSHFGGILSLEPRPDQFLYPSFGEAVDAYLRDPKAFGESSL